MTSTLHREVQQAGVCLESSCRRWQAYISSDEDLNESLAAIVSKMTYASSGHCLASCWPNSWQTSHDGTWLTVTPVWLLHPKTLHLSGCGDGTGQVQVQPFDGYIW
jgi:hypothetical protein